MESKLSIVTLGVSDLERSRLFYVQGLGCPVVRADESMIFLQLGSLLLGLYPMEGLDWEVDVAFQRTPARLGGATLARACRSRKEVDRLMGRVRSAGGCVLQQARETVWGGYAGCFSDPDRHLWEVLWGPMFQFDEGGQVSIDPVHPKIPTSLVH